MQTTLINGNHTKTENEEGVVYQLLKFVIIILEWQLWKNREKQQRWRAVPPRVNQHFSASSIWRLLELLSGWRGVMNNVRVWFGRWGREGSVGNGENNENERQLSHPDSRSTSLCLRLQPSGSQRWLGFLVILFSWERKRNKGHFCHVTLTYICILISPEGFFILYSTNVLIQQMKCICNCLCFIRNH